MLTKDDLLAIADLLKVEREETRKLIGASEENIKVYLAENNIVLMRLFGIELGETKRNIGELTKVVKAVAMQLEENMERIEVMEEEVGAKHQKN